MGGIKIVFLICSCKCHHLPGPRDVNAEPGGALGLVSCVGVFVTPCVMLCRSLWMPEGEMGGCLTDLFTKVIMTSFVQDEEHSVYPLRMALEIQPSSLQKL